MCGQSDRVYEAVEGSGEWERTGRQKDLRAMFSLHAESVVLVAVPMGATPGRYAQPIASGVLQIGVAAGPGFAL